MIRESLLSSAILNIAGVFKVYEIVLSLTNGGPGYSSCTVAAYMMAKMFDESQFGYGSAISTVIFILCSALSLILISLNNSKKVQY
jgi:ABC-type sugar transport system permease subunit